ncbi:MAG: hypothetical protein IAE90_01240 [Ignavibacteria bacterium]|nr:hypothetical protein [Ignavibacteria bacterium]
MKKTILLFLPVLALMIGIASCGNNDTGTGLLGNNNAVTFTMGVQNSTNGVQFTWQPSVDVKVTKLILSTTGFSDTITDNTGATYTANQPWAYGNEYTGVTTGQQWQFSFTGTLASNNQAFTSTANLTIP